MNCKPGDMARMVECGQRAAVGLIVEVEERCGDHAEHGPMWLCKAASGARADEGFCKPGELCHIPDKWLRPIRPDESPADEAIACGVRACATCGGSGEVRGWETIHGKRRAVVNNCPDCRGNAGVTGTSCTYPHCSGDKPEDGGCCGDATPCKQHHLIACAECAFGVGMPREGQQE